jgi:opacity protein-like surface antigen
MAKFSSILRRSVFTLAALVVISIGAFAQDYPKAEVFGGYSYLYSDGESLNGFKASVAANMHQNFGIAVDVSGHYYKEGFSFGDSFAGLTGDTYTIVAGPRFSSRTNSRVTPFAHVQAGMARTSGGVDVFGYGVSDSETGFAMTAGGGVDVNVSKSIAIRVAQADFLMTRLGGETQKNFQYSAGIVFKF